MLSCARQLPNGAQLQSRAVWQQSWYFYTMMGTRHNHSKAHGTATLETQLPECARPCTLAPRVGTLGFHQIPPGWEVRFGSVAYSAMPDPNACALLWQQQLGS